MKDIAAICRELKTKKQVVVTSHIAPDPDAIGSSVSLVLGLKQSGVAASLYLKDPIPERMLPLVGGLPVTHLVPQQKAAALVVVDTASAKRVGDDYQALFQQAEQVFNIDHHVSNEGFGDIQYIDPAAAASAEIIRAILSELAVMITPQIANLLYAGILDDTGCFRFSNSSRRALECAALLISSGAEPQHVANQLYFSIPRQVLQLRALALGGMRFIAGDKLSVVVVSQEMLNQCAAKTEDTEGIVDEARAVLGTVGAVFLRQLSDGWKVSLRSKDERFDVNRIAAIFGGGGHTAAAGCKIEGTLQQAEARLFPELEQAVRALSK